MDEIKRKSLGGYVSPYLRRPLRTFADVLADQETYRRQSQDLRSAVLTASKAQPARKASQSRRH